MEVLNWLLKSDSYVQHAVRKNILHESKIELSDIRVDLLADVRIRQYLADIAAFNSKLVTSHKNPSLPIHKLMFLFDVGLGTEVSEIQTAISQIIENRDENGVPRSMTNVPVHYGGLGIDTLGWALCDAPLMLHALVRAGVDYDKFVKKGVDYILGLFKGSGFSCEVSEELGKFRGPGKKSDCCPYANLIILKLLSAIPEQDKSDLKEAIIDLLLGLWERSRETHPFMFFMGTDFRKLKAPALWYDIVSVTDCLSLYEYARCDRRFNEMIDIIESKAAVGQWFVPESVYLKCKDWDFGQKTETSPWLTYLCIRILERCGRISFELNPGV